MHGKRDPRHVCTVEGESDKPHIFGARMNSLQKSFSQKKEAERPTAVRWRKIGDIRGRLVAGRQLPPVFGSIARKIVVNGSRISLSHAPDDSSTPVA